MFTFHEASAAQVADLRAEYLQSLAAPIDGMWAALMGFATQHEIRAGDQRAGYACIDAEGLMLQFHVRAAFRGQAHRAFLEALGTCRPSGALAASFEPWLALCLEVPGTARDHTLLFQLESEDREPSRTEHARTSGSADDLSFSIVPESEREAAEAFLRTALPEDPGQWLTGYLLHLVQRSELWALRSGEKILGTGELRVSDAQPPFADLGVVVGREHRGRGLAPRILESLVDSCQQADLIPICSTTIENHSARRAITRAGFVVRYRMIEVRFEQPSEEPGSPGAQG